MQVLCRQGFFTCSVHARGVRLREQQPNGLRIFRRHSCRPETGWPRNTWHAQRLGSRFAYRLGITYRTVTFHKYRMMERLGITTNAGLMSYALKRNISESFEDVAVVPA